MRLKTRPRTRTLFATASIPIFGGLGTMLMLTGMGCGGLGDKSSGDQAGQINGKFQITPSNATVVTGQTFHFTASSPWGGGANWTVLPAAGGTVDAEGNFTASSLLGQYRIVAMWSKDVRYTAVATVTVVPPPPPAHLNPNLVQASGLTQATAGGNVRNAIVVGESVPAQKATSASGNLEVRHGFEPPAAP